MSTGTSSSAAIPRDSDEFFIGWEPVPRNHIRFLRPFCWFVLAVTISVAGLLAFEQRSPGPGRWDRDSVVELDGIACAMPYAMLHVPGDTPRSFLLVEEGKFGALERIEKLTERPEKGRAVRVRGTLLQREGRWMIELAEGERGLRPLTADEEQKLPAMSPPRPEILAERVTLRGEIIDPKCYLGAMKPGGGKTHKGCAALCLSGGIPPMLVTRSPSRRETYYLLTTAEGRPAGDLVLPFVGDQVEMTGRLERHGDLLVLKLAEELVRRH